MFFLENGKIIAYGKGLNRKFVNPWIDISNEVLYASNKIICQSYNPNKLMYQLTPTRPTKFWCFIS
jgi:hypothetical protein